MSDEPMEAGKPLEADEADAVEQRLAVPDPEQDDEAPAEALPDDVNPADAVEQHRTVGEDEDDYR